MAGWRGESHLLATFAGGIDARDYAAEAFGELLCALGVNLHRIGHGRTTVGELGLRV